MKCETCGHDPKDFRKHLVYVKVQRLVLIEKCSYGECHSYVEINCEPVSDLPWQGKDWKTLACSAQKIRIEKQGYELVERRQEPDGDCSQKYTWIFEKPVLAQLPLCLTD